MGLGGGVAGTSPCAGGVYLMGEPLLVLWVAFITSELGEAGGAGAAVRCADSAVSLSAVVRSSPWPLCAWF